MVLEGKTFFDIHNSYWLLKQISEEQRDDLFCKIDVELEEGTEIEQIIYKKISLVNTIIMFTNNNNAANIKSIGPSQKPI